MLGHKTSFIGCLRLIGRISKCIEDNNWVDIENQFYDLLSGGPYREIAPLDLVLKTNNELTVLKNCLVEYLNEISICANLKNNKIRELMFEPISQADVAVANKKEMQAHIRENFNSDTIILTQQYKLYVDDSEKLLQFAKDYQAKNPNKSPELILSPNLEYFSFPREVMLLNFNYTDTEKLYYSNGSTVQVNHIHGTLKNPGSVIFGYGDELDSKYKKILELNENEYLQNMKSCHYLESGNYRKMLSFIESAPYQVYIMGHSCGNSDRTLLNTLFEHKNCVSIKPFYYQDPSGHDNYIDIVQNISRVFTNMQLMRDRVVSKDRCKPLPQNEA